jgi:hypothetical protein
MKEVYGEMPQSRMVWETGTHFPWVSRVLSELGHEVIVAHARNVCLIGESRKMMIGWMPERWLDWCGLIRSCWRR